MQKKNSTVLLYVYTSTPPQQYQYVPKETVRHQKGTWGPRRPVRGLLSSLSRAKRLVDLMVEPMSFDRIGNLGNSSTMKARLQEEVRRVELAQGTRVRYTDMGVFSAVAGN